MGLVAPSCGITYPVDVHGRVSPADVWAAITSRTVLVSIMHANKETGTLRPSRSWRGSQHEVGVPFHTDAAHCDL